MHFQFLVEDYSSGVLIELLMGKIMSGNPDVTY